MYRPPSSERLIRDTKYELSRCPICSASDAVEIADRTAIEIERERLWSFYSARLRHPVPAVQLADRLVFSQLPALRFLRCSNCTHLYRNPRERGDEVLRAYADEALDDTLAQTFFANQRTASAARLRRLLHFAPHIRNGLEVGSYVGGFLSVAEAAGLSFTGLDVNGSAADFATKRGLRVLVGEIDELDGEGGYDAVAIWNTFEQLPDVRNAVHSARRLLRKSNGTHGTLVVRIPNSAFYIRWRNRLSGPLGAVAERVLAHNNLLGFPYREGFTAKSVEHLFDSCGFDIRCVYGDTLVPLADRWTGRLAAFEEAATKRIQRIAQRGWSAPWVEIYATLR